MSGKPLDKLLGMKATLLTTKKSRRGAFQALRQLQTDSKSRFDCHLKVSSSRNIPISICFSYFEFQGETQILATARDLSYLKEKAQKSNAYEESLAGAIE